MSKYTNEELAAKLGWEGFDYILDEIAPSSIEDDEIAEALEDAQVAVRILRRIMDAKGALGEW